MEEGAGAGGAVLWVGALPLLLAPTYSGPGKASLTEPRGTCHSPRSVSSQDDFLLIHYDKGPCRNKLGHSRASVIWHRTQVGGGSPGAFSCPRENVCVRKLVGDVLFRKVELVKVGPARTFLALRLGFW